MGILSFFFQVVAYVFNLFILIWLFESSTDGESKQVGEPEEFSDGFSAFRDFGTRTIFFMRITVTVLMSQGTLTVLIVD